MLRVTTEDYVRYSVAMSLPNCRAVYNLEPALSSPKGMTRKVCFRTAIDDLVMNFACGQLTATCPDIYPLMIDELLSERQVIVTVKKAAQFKSGAILQFAVYGTNNSVVVVYRFFHAVTVVVDDHGILRFAQQFQEVTDNRIIIIDFRRSGLDA